MAFQSQAGLECSLSVGILTGLEATYESICVVGTFDLVLNLALPCTAGLPQCEGD